jgi:hypothetical protein
MSTNDVLEDGNANSNIVSISASKIGDRSKVLEESMPPLLPRSAWNSQVAFLRVLFRAKKALDRIEMEAGVLKT